MDATAQGTEPTTPWLVAAALLTLPVAQVLAYLAAFRALDSSEPDVVAAHFRAVLGLGAALMSLALVWRPLRLHQVRPAWVAAAAIGGLAEGALLAWNLPNDFGGFIVLYELALLATGPLWGTFLLASAFMSFYRPTRATWTTLTAASVGATAVHAILFAYLLLRIEFLADAAASADRGPFLPGHGWLAAVAALALVGLSRPRPQH